MLIRALCQVKPSFRTRVLARIEPKAQLPGTLGDRPVPSRSVPCGNSDLDRQQAVMNDFGQLLMASLQGTGRKNATLPRGLCVRTIQLTAIHICKIPINNHRK